ncbi:hypothetical protein [Bradyrhizobium sp. ISRA442]|uniref:hypothetical protein n=1 Tax=Bradyrhizobium sp. ISRA442 TaxID=2866197 RepID=UPI00311AE517
MSARKPDARPRIALVEPVTAMRRLAHQALDSAAKHSLLGRYSYVACDPFSSYEGKRIVLSIRWISVSSSTFRS